MWHLILESDGLFDVCSSRQAAKEVHRLINEGKATKKLRK